MNITTTREHRELIRSRRCLGIRTTSSLQLLLQYFLYGCTKSHENSTLKRWHLLCKLKAFINKRWQIRHTLNSPEVLPYLPGAELRNIAVLIPVNGSRSMYLSSDPTFARYRGDEMSSSPSRGYPHRCSPQFRWCLYSHYILVCSIATGAAAATVAATTTKYSRAYTVYRLRMNLTGELPEK